MEAWDARNQALLAALAIQCGRRAQSLLQDASGALLRATKELPHGFPPGPRYDVALEMAANPLRFMEDTKSQYGDGLAGFKLASQPVVLISSPKFAEEVFSSSIFVKSGTAFFPGNSLAGNGLLVSDGEMWLRQRRLSNPAFRKAAIETYAETTTELSYEMVHSWAGDGIRDVAEDFNQLAMKIVGSALFGTSVQGPDSMLEIVSAIRMAFKFFMERATSMFIVPEWVPTPGNIQYHAAVARLDEAVYEMINHRRLQLAASSSSHDKQDLLTRLLQAKDEDGSGMDDVALRDELMTFLVAGQETSSALLSFCFVMLAAHEEVQEKLYSEVSEGSTHWDSLHYTQAVILETMRLLPPAYIVGRCANRDTSLGDWRIPAGTTALVSLYLLHRDPEFWPRALEFDPERWLPSRGAKAYLGSGSYWPFGGGARNCIGSGFAMMELSLVLSAVLRTHKISFPPGSFVPKPLAMITLRPQSPLYLRVTKRKTRTL